MAHLPAGTTRRGGATLVETAFVLSAAVLFLFAIFEYGRFMMVRQLLDNAAREGARYAVVHTYDGTTQQVQDQADNFLAGQGSQLQAYNKYTSIQVFKSDAGGNNIGAWNDAGFGESIAVQIDGSYKPFFPTLLKMGGTIPLHSVSVMYSEAN